LRNKNNLLPEAILTSPSVVSHVDRKGRHGSTVTVVIAMETIAMATGLSGRCSLRYALSVEKIPRYHSNPAKIGRCIAAIATIRSD